MEKRQMICVLCGQEWGVKFPFTNICENEKCKGVCTWGYELGKPLSWNIDENKKWHLNSVPHKDKIE